MDIKQFLISAKNGWLRKLKIKDYNEDRRTNKLHKIPGRCTRTAHAPAPAPHLHMTCTCTCTCTCIHSPNLPYSEGIGSPAAAIPVLKVM